MGNSFSDEKFDSLKSEYLNCISDLLKNDKLYDMKGHKKHGATDCLEHCLLVSYYSFLVCKKLKLDYHSAARGGLLHDFYLYDKESKNTIAHRIKHSKIALKNARQCYELSKKEEDIILHHMWPITPAFPRCKEAYVVDVVDKYCAFLETAGSKKTAVIEEIRKLISD